MSSSSSLSSTPSSSSFSFCFRRRQYPHYHHHHCRYCCHQQYWHNHYLFPRYVSNNEIEYGVPEGTPKPKPPKLKKSDIVKPTTFALADRLVDEVRSFTILIYVCVWLSFLHHVMFLAPRTVQLNPIRHVSEHFSTAQSYFESNIIYTFLFQMCYLPRLAFLSFIKLFISVLVRPTVCIHFFYVYHISAWIQAIYIPLSSICATSYERFYMNDCRNKQLVLHTLHWFMC